MSESTADLLIGTAHRLRRLFLAATLDTEVTPAQARALRTVLDAGDVRPSMLAERLRIAARSATEVVDALEARGLVRREPDPADRRATLVRATPAAVAQLSDVERVRQEQAEAFLSVLSDRDRRSLDRILGVLVAQPEPEALVHLAAEHRRGRGQHRWGGGGGR